MSLARMVRCRARTPVLALALATAVSWAAPWISASSAENRAISAEPPPSAAAPAADESPAQRFLRLLRAVCRREPSPPVAPPGTETSIRFAPANDRLDAPISHGLVFGATWIDLDGDGDLDLTIPVDAESTGNLHVWRNDCGRFHEITGALGLSAIGAARSAAWLDLDGDGDLDLYVTQRSDASGNLLFENRRGALVDVTAGSGLDGPATDVAQAWADFDGDGDFDVYLPGVEVTRPRLMRNDGGFHFTDVTLAQSLDPLARSLSAAWADFDGDGDPDLAVGEVSGYHVYRNESPDGFVDITPRALPGPFIVVPSWADVDGDGDLDLLVGGGFPPLLFENRFSAGADPSTFFVDRTLDWGSGPPRGSGGNWVDLDLDGDLDLLADGGSIGARVVENRINLGEGLLDITDVAGLPPLRGITWHPAAGDFDGDGRIDFFAPHEISPALYRNESVVAGGALRLDLVPRRGVVPIGARVTLELDGRVQMREVSWPASAFSFGSPQVVLATGPRRKVRSVDVRWASGRRERFYALRTGRLERLVEGHGRAIRPREAPEPAPFALPALMRDIVPSCNPCRDKLVAELPSASMSETGAPTGGSESARVLDVRGRTVRTLAPSGSRVEWDLRDEGGRRVAPGIYWLEAVSAAGARTTARVVVLP